MYRWNSLKWSAALAAEVIDSDAENTQMELTHFNERIMTDIVRNKILKKYSKEVLSLA